MEKGGFVYILASKPRGVLYVGVTSDLLGRTYQHKQGLAEGFSKRYRVKLLVYYEAHQEISEAILREKQIKKWYRDWKIELIESMNPEWRDLYAELF